MNFEEKILVRINTVTDCERQECKRLEQAITDRRIKMDTGTWVGKGKRDWYLDTLKIDEQSTVLRLLENSILTYNTYRRHRHKDGEGS